MKKTLIIKWKLKEPETIRILRLLPELGRKEQKERSNMSLISQCRAEPGNLAGNAWRDRSAPARFVLDEAYTDSAAVAAHGETPSYKDYSSKINDLADRTVLALIPAKS